MKDCIFCKIVNKEIPSTLVHEDDKVIAFPDINPKAPLHYLIIPRKHIATLNDLTDDDTFLAGHLLQTAKSIAEKMGIAEPGYRVSINCNKGGGQLVYHIHLHLMGGREMHWPPG